MEKLGIPERVFDVVVVSTELVRGAAVVRLASGDELVILALRGRYQVGDVGCLELCAKGQASFEPYDEPTLRRMPECDDNPGGLWAWSARGSDRLYLSPSGELPALPTQGVVERAQIPS